MTELKTLKDFEHEGNLIPRHMIEENKSFDNSIKWVENRLLKKLKAEAVKWVKSWRENKFAWTEEEWKDFFNLTEEDLK